MRDLLTWLALLLAGPGLLSLGLWSLRTRTWHDGVPAAELMIVRALGDEPAPRNATDRRFARINAGLCVLFGAFFSFLGLAALYSSFASE